MRTNIILLMLLLTIGAYGADVKEGIYEFDVTSPTTVKLTKTLLAWEKDTTKLVVPATVTLHHHELAVTGIGQSVFEYLSVDSIVLPPTVTTIDERAFYNCRKLTYVNLPVGLEMVPSECFEGCSKLSKVTLPDGITRIGGSAFAESSVREMVFPPSLRVVGSGAFSSCTKLERVVFQGPLEKIWFGAFGGCSKLKDIQFNGAIKSLNGFENCTSLEEVVLPEGLEAIEGGVFQHCTNLKAITIPQSVREMGQSVFNGCASLKEVVLPAAMPTMSLWLFQDCTSLERLTIGEGTTSIGGSALDGCTSLRHIVVRSQQPPAYNDNTFTQEILDMFEHAELVVPTGCMGTYQAADFWKNFKHVSEQDMGTCYRNLLLHVGEGGAVAYGQWTIGPEGGCMLIPIGEKATFTLLPDDDHAADYVELRYPINRSHYYTNEVVDNRFTIDAMTENGELYVRFADALVDVDVIQTEMGVVTLSVAKNHSLRYQIQPDEGWLVHSLTFNGEDITGQIQRGTYIDTPVLREKSIIRIAYEKDGAGVEAVADSRLRVLGCDGGIVVDHAPEGQTVSIYALDGKLIRLAAVTHSPLMIPLPAGQVYVICIGQKTIKIRL